MSVVARRFSSSPVRIPSATWEAIISVIAFDSNDAKTQLNSIAGIVSSLIADETPLKDAITIIGNGPRLRIYCHYGDDAISDESNESSLSFNPFNGEWEVYFPVHEADLNWVTKALKEKNTRFKAYKTGDKIDAEKDEETENSNFSQLTINTDKFK